MAFAVVPGNSCGKPPGHLLVTWASAVGSHEKTDAATGSNRNWVEVRFTLAFSYAFASSINLDWIGAGCSKIRGDRPITTAAAAATSAEGKYLAGLA